MLLFLICSAADPIIDLFLEDQKNNTVLVCLVKREGYKVYIIIFCKTRVILIILTVLTPLLNFSLFLLSFNSSTERKLAVVLKRNAEMKIVCTL